MISRTERQKVVANVLPTLEWPRWLSTDSQQTPFPVQESQHPSKQIKNQKLILLAPTPRLRRHTCCRLFWRQPVALLSPAALLASPLALSPHTRVLCSPRAFCVALCSSFPCCCSFVYCVDWFVMCSFPIHCLLIVLFVPAQHKHTTHHHCTQ